MTMSRKRGAIHKWFGEKIILRPINGTTGEDLASQDDIILPFKYECSIADNVEVDIIRNSHGRILVVLEGEETPKITGIIKQSDKDTVDFFMTDCRKQFYRVYMDLDIVDNKHQELFAGIVQVKPGFELKEGDRSIPFEMYIIDNDLDVTIASASLPADINHSTDVTIPKHIPFVILEKAVA